MANKAISELPQAQNVNNQDLFVLEQSGIAKKLTAETFITEQGIINALAEALDGHGGIQSVTLSSVSGRIRTYRITFTDQSATTFQVYDGTSIDRISRTSSSGLDDVYTIFLSDGTTTFFTVHNGADGTVSEAMLNDALKDKAPAITETTESSAIATFTDGADDMVMHNVVAEINPVQDLSNGDPSPSNICPITGHTEVNVTRTGANVWDEEWEVGALSTTDGTPIASTVTIRSKNFSPIVSGAPYYVKCANYTDRYALGVYWYDADKVFISREYACAIVTTAPANAKYFKIVTNSSGTVYGATYNHDISVNYPSSDHDYHAYQGNSVSLSWQTEAGTVYGGTIDVATGLLTVEYVRRTITSFTGVFGAVTNGYCAYAVVNSTTRVPSDVDPTFMKSNVFTYTSATRYDAALYTYGGNAGGSTTYSFILPSSVTSLADANAWLADNPTEFTCKLATPQTYQLTGQQLLTLLGTNNVWTDIGNVSVTYPADTKMFIEKLTMPTEDDLVANQAITSGKYFMIGNSLYLALANIASGAQITIGTNAQRVSLADALNTINS